MEVIFKNPQYLWFLISIILLVVIHFYTLKHQKRKALRFANFDAIARVTGEEILSKNVSILFIRAAALFLITIALAGTTIWYQGQTSEANFVLAIDASTSMSATDFSPSRIEAAKDSAIKFVESVGTNTQVGVVSFSGASFIEEDMTEEYKEVKDSIRNIQISSYGGTDLGEAIISATNLLLKDDKPRALVLLTDGRSNIGVPLEDAVSYANENKVTIHTIGVGTPEGGTFAGEATSRLDEESLKTIALNTDGNYYKASDKKALEEAYGQIIKLNKQRVSFNATPTAMLVALLILFVEWALISTKYKILP
ncbi:MAG: VWA domain-containing protein [Nanoarchaeota archaeon]|nr:VWA domain-containing protein [Nanoarchaeota archaeon]